MWFFLYPINFFTGYYWTKYCTTNKKLAPPLPITTRSVGKGFQIVNLSENSNSTVALSRNVDFIWFGASHSLSEVECDTTVTNINPRSIRVCQM